MHTLFPTRTLVKTDWAVTLCAVHTYFTPDMHMVSWSDQQVI